MTTRRSLLALCFLPLLPAQALAGRARKNKPTRPAPLPPGYAVVAQRHGVPSDLLYAVALQESKMLYGRSALPYPWTLNIQGKPHRYATYEEAVAALSICIQRGITNVDCGLLQVNWGYHRRSLGSVARALDPYPNMAVGAQLLRKHFDKTGSWFKATGWYHSMTPGRTERYAQSVFQILADIPRQNHEALNG